MNQEHVGESKIVRPVVKWLLVLIVLVAGGAVMAYLVKNPVKADKQKQADMVPSVETVTVVAEDYKVEISAQGQVEAVTMTELVSEVSGAITFVSPKLKAGEYFDEGEKLLEINRADYLVQLEQNRSAVADAELQVAQEEARAEQALRDWKRLGRPGEPSALVKREPQLKSARARLQASKALVVKSERDLEKTVVKAPYACFIESSFVNDGGYMTPAGRIATIYAAGKVQVRLPLSLEDVAYLPRELVGVEVSLESALGSNTRMWSGHVVRTEGVVDRATHTMMIVVEVNSSNENEQFKVPPLGMFVKGMFEARELGKVLRLPRVAIRNGDEVWSVNEDGRLEIQEVQVERRARDYVIVVSGLADGARVITSPIELPMQGMAVDAVESPNKN